MNAPLLSLLAALLLALPAKAQTAADGQKRYDAGDYAGAAAAYAALAAEQPREPAWRMNLGNALFKQGKLGPAIASYHRAFSLAPRDGDIRFNLEFALRRAGEELVPAGAPPLLFRAYHLLSAAELAGIHWIFCWSSLLLAAAWLLRPRARDGLSAWAGWSLAAWALFGGWWGARSYTDPALGVVVAPTAELRSGPGPSFSVGYTVPEGRRAEVVGQEGEWLEVVLPKEGAKGFIRADQIEKI